MASERVSALTERAQERTLTRIDGADAAEAVILFSGISLRLWRLYAYFWLVCLLFPILALAQTHSTLEQWSIALAGLLLFVIGYVWIMWPHPLSSAARVRAQSWVAQLLSVILTALVLALSLMYGSAFLWLFVGVSAVAGVVLSARSAFVVVMGLTLLTLCMSVIVSGGIAQTDWLHILPLVLLVRRSARAGAPGSDRGAAEDGSRFARPAGSHFILDCPEE
jgi:two-component system sensor histidine kinase DesK